MLQRPEGVLSKRCPPCGRSTLASRGRLTAAQDRRLERERARNRTPPRAKLRTLGPAATLERGYAIALDGEGHVLRTATGVQPGDPVEVRLAAGSLTTRVEETTP